MEAIVFLSTLSGPANTTDILLSWVESDYLPQTCLHSLRSLQGLLSECLAASLKLALDRLQSLPHLIPDLDTLMGVPLMPSGLYRPYRLPAAGSSPLQPLLAK